MPRNITFKKRHEEVAIEIIRNWSSPKLTWQLLADEFNDTCGTNFKQLTFKSRDILKYELRKQKEIIREQLCGYKKPRDISDEISKMKSQIKFLKEENAVLRDLVSHYAILATRNSEVQIEHLLLGQE